MNPSAHLHNLDSSRSRFPGGRGVRGVLAGSKLMKELPICPKCHPNSIRVGRNRIVGHLGTRAVPCRGDERPRRTGGHDWVFHNSLVTSVTASTASESLRWVAGTSGLRVPASREPHFSRALRECLP